MTSKRAQNIGSSSNQVFMQSGLGLGRRADLMELVQREVRGDAEKT
jgi:hypothetical protein